MTTATISKTQTGTGYSQQEDAFSAGVQIANMAIKDKKLSEHTIFWLFATPNHDVKMLITGLRSVIGDGPTIIGGSTIGIVTNDFLSYTGIMAGGGFISSSESFFKISTEGSIREREYEAGSNLGKKIREGGISPDDSLLLIYDCLKNTHEEGPMAFNLGVPLLDGLYEQIKQWPTTAGVGVIGDMTGANPCAIWVNENIVRHGLASVVFSQVLRMDTVILQGTSPASGYHTITRAEHNIIYEIDGKPALEAIDELTGHTMTWDDYPLFVTLGVNNGDKFGEYIAENYSNRFCIAVDKEQKALIMVENDLIQGQEVQLMRREVDFKYIKPRIENLLSRVSDRKPVFAFYIDCIGRVSAFSGMPEEESLEVIKLLGDIPIFGIFSGVEIANISTTVKPLDWTGVVCLFSEA